MATINVTLPADGDTIDASDYNVPVNTIVNEINGNLDNSNIDSAAAISGSKLADGSVPPDKLATGAIFLGYAERASDFTTTSTSVVDVTDLSVTVTIPAGGRKVKITGYSRWIGGNGTVEMFITDGSNTQIQRATSSVNMYNANIVGYDTPSAGSKTYKIRASQGSAGTLTFRGNTAFILVELV
jgi:hypothetical protein